MYRAILVPLDGSTLAEEAVVAVERFLALATTGEIVLAHVVHPMVMAVAMRSERRPDVEFADRYLQPMVERLRAGGRTTRAATATDANIARALVGSMADKLIRTASIPVLVVPTEERRE